MKNKHLVLLFLAVLAIGWVARKMPFWRSEHLETDLIQADSATINRILLDLPGQPELSFERADSGWLATQDGRSVPAPQAIMDSLLTTLTQVQMIRIVKSRRIDTLGLAETGSTLVQIFERNRCTDRFRLGREVLENGAPATYLELPGHEGIYLVKGHLLSVFSRKMAEFRLNTALRFDPAQIGTVRLLGKNGEDQQWLKNDSLQVWLHADTLLNCPDEVAMAWLRQLQRLNGRPFADGFDESRAPAHQVAEIILQGKKTGAEPLTLRIFYVAPPDLPEDLSQMRSKKGALTPWVFHSSQNPDNYFALEDSTLAKLLCLGLPRQTLLSPSPKK